VSRLDLAAFKPARLEDAGTILSFLDKTDLRFCDYSFVNQVIWGEIYELTWQIAAERFWIYSKKLRRLPVPLGRPITAVELHRIAADLARQGVQVKFGFADQRFLEQNPDIASLFEIVPEPQNADYIYSTQKLIELKGNKLAKKKNLISQFYRLYDGAVVLPLDTADADDCIRLAKEWCRIKTCDQEGYEHEKSALARALHLFEPLHLEGLKLVLKNKLIAFSIVSPLNRDTADVHFEKSDPTVKGAAQVINQETARSLAGRFSWINREQDLGIDGLRQAKRSYVPDEILMPYKLVPK